MIRYYAYYSCGGYKDMFIGSDTDLAKASYFIPLLPIWLKTDKPENGEKIKRAESVQKIGIVTQSKSFGFPSECSIMFSHGGYKAIYRVMENGNTCLCIRDIKNGAKDEEDRVIPFNFLFVADNPESIVKLDAFALKYLSNSSEIDSKIGEAITYDPYINGVKFNLEEINSLILDCSWAKDKLRHKHGRVIYLKLDSRQNVKIALSEQNINSDKVDALYDRDGLYSGGLPFITMHRDEAKIETEKTGGNENLASLNTEDNKENEIKQSELVQKEGLVLLSASGIPGTTEPEDSNGLKEDKEISNILEGDDSKEDTVLFNVGEYHKMLEHLLDEKCGNLKRLVESITKEDLSTIKNELQDSSESLRNKLQEVSLHLEKLSDKVTAQKVEEKKIPSDLIFLLSKRNLFFGAIIFILGFLMGALIF